MNNLTYLFAAYSLIFLALFCYLLFIWRRQARLESELQQLEAWRRNRSAQSSQAKSRSAS